LEFLGTVTLVPAPLGGPTSRRAANERVVIRRHG
jgi:hypothetical protein